MKKYDVIVLGSGAGSGIAEESVGHGLKTALIDKGPLGGTCLNVGCIPSKLLIYPADRVAEIEEGRKLGIMADVKDVDFRSIMGRMRAYVEDGQSHIREGLSHTAGLDLYEKEAYFVDDYTLDVAGMKIRGDKIFIGTGARPMIPLIKGIEKVQYLTNESLLQLKRRPASLVIIGGGYISVEFAHFFASMGTVVTVIQRGDRLVPWEEPEVSELLYSELSRRMRVELGSEVVEVKRKKGKTEVITKNLKTGKKGTFTAENILVAAGRRSNADILKVENTGVEVDAHGFIKTNEFLETSKENIWCIGDANGREMFRHVANMEADLAWHNSMDEKKVAMNYAATPHAVFTHPQIASVGMREAEAQKSHAILVGRAGYNEVAKGEAMMEERGFAKAIVDRETMKILGFHIIGPYAPILIQEVVNTMANDLDIYSLGNSMHIHPSLSELIVSTLGNLEEK